MRSLVLLFVMAFIASATNATNAIAQTSLFEASTPSTGRMRLSVLDDSGFRGWQDQIALCYVPDRGSSSTDIDQFECQPNIGPQQDDLSNSELLGTIAPVGNLGFRKTSERNRSGHGVYVEAVDLRRSTPRARSGITPIKPGASSSIRLAAVYQDWEIVWADVDAFRGEQSGFVYESQLTSVELNRRLFEGPLWNGCLECKGGWRYFGLIDRVSCPPFEQVAANRLIGPQGIVRWRRRIGGNVEYFSRLTFGVAANFVDKRHGDFFNDQEVLASAQLDVRTGLDVNLVRGFHAHVVYQAYSVFNVRAAYSATPTFVETPEDHVFVHGVAIGFNKRF